MHRPPLNMTEHSIFFVINGRQHTVDRTHPNFEMLRTAIKEKRWADLEDLADIPKAVNRYSEGKYVITEDDVLYEGEPIHGVIKRRLLSFFEEGIDFGYLLKFHERLQANPSSRAVNELYDFLEHKNIPIGEDGTFYAYKAIRPDWKDIFSGTVDNSIGQAPEMARNQVDDDCTRHCSRGYHVGSLDYVKWYGREDSIYVICKVDPADVVSVPKDHNCQKVRVCRYEVVSQYTGPLPETVWNHVPLDEYDWDEDDEPEEEECPICLGTGFYENECPHCFEGEACEWCHGARTVEDYCEECDGEGFILNY